MHLVKSTLYDSALTSGLFLIYCYFLLRNFQTRVLINIVLIGKECSIHSVEFA